MNRVTRLLALAGVGVGVAASVAVGTAPAQAADASGSNSTTVQTKANNWRHDDYRVEDTYRTLGRCLREGRIGELDNDWDDFACFPVRYGYRHGVWALVVSDDEDCDWDNYSDGRFYTGDRGYYGDRGLRGIRGFDRRFN
jgi:hypothetical protein